MRGLDSGEGTGLGRGLDSGQGTGSGEGTGLRREDWIHERNWTQEGTGLRRAGWAQGWAGLHLWFVGSLFSGIELASSGGWREKTA